MGSVYLDRHKFDACKNDYLKLADPPTVEAL
jgi:hypothetical protein